MMSWFGCFVLVVCDVVWVYLLNVVLVSSLSVMYMSMVVKLVCMCCVVRWCDVLWLVVMLSVVVMVNYSVMLSGVCVLDMSVVSMLFVLISVIIISDVVIILCIDMFVNLCSIGMIMKLLLMLSNFVIRLVIVLVDVSVMFMGYDYMSWLVLGLMWLMYSGDVLVFVVICCSVCCSRWLVMISIVSVNSVSSRCCGSMCVSCMLRVVSGMLVIVISNVVW